MKLLYLLPKEKIIDYFKVSAKTGEGVDLLLNHIINSLVKKYMKNIIQKDINFELQNKKNKWLLIEVKNNSFLLLEDKIKKKRKKVKMMF